MMSMNPTTQAAVDRLLELAEQPDSDPAELRRLARTIPIASPGLTKEQIERLCELVTDPPKGDLPAPSCPEWCEGGCDWGHAIGDEFAAFHTSTLGTVTLSSSRDVTVMVTAMEAIVAGQPAELDPPKIGLFGDPDTEMNADQAVALMKLMSAAVDRLVEITGERTACCCSVEPCRACWLADHADAEPAGQVDPADEPDTPAESAPESALGPSVAELVQQWMAARARTFGAQHGFGTLDPEDLWSELALGGLIAREVTCGRWCALAELLRAGAVASWAQVGRALEMTEAEAADGFNNWISGQRNLHQRTGSIGLTGAEADQLVELTKAVA